MTFGEKSKIAYCCVKMLALPPTSQKAQKLNIQNDTFKLFCLIL
jgi:hypothetical protein